MGETTGIAWTDHTFNPWLGCTRVSEGCRHCYAEQLVEGRMGLKRWGSAARVRTKESWKQVDKWNTWSMGAVAKREPRRRVFCASLADVFEDAPGLDEIRADLWNVIERCKALDWQLLTKRPENIMRMIPPAWWENPPPHVWYGTSVEDQKSADKRVPILLGVPAAVRFLSCEPLLGPVELDYWLKVCKHWKNEDSLPAAPWHPPYPKHWHEQQSLVLAGWSPPIQWVIAGGESGQGARECRVQWIGSIVEQCRIAGVACFVKQMGAVPTITPGRGADTRAAYEDERAQCLAWPEGTKFTGSRGAPDPSLNGRVIALRDRKGGDPTEWPLSLQVQQFPATSRVTKFP